tara:strand:+ start:23670 stop:24098 length:429 start_codon:yes stop_codon:yes gene_type:complete
LEAIDLYVDGDCALCAASVRFLNKGIKKKYFITVHHIQGANIFLPEEVKSLKSVGILYRNKWHSEWSAVRLCLKVKPRFGYRILYYLSYILPTFIGNALYRFFSKRRLSFSKFLGNDVCLLPSAFFPLNKSSQIQLSPKIKT